MPVPPPLLLCSAHADSSLQLIIISGFPCSGKTTRSEELAAYLNSRIAATSSRLTVAHLNPPISRSLYSDARAEKLSRSEYYSLVKRHLSRDTLVIADGLNYIKGLRYQLFCEAKSALTPSCVIHVAAPPDKCREWNTAGPEDDRYPEDVLENLIFRYEEPNPMARWDSPCFVVPWMDANMDCEAVWRAMVEDAKPVKANLSTAPKVVVEGDYLHELDKVTQGVVALVQAHQKAGGSGRVKVPDCAVELELPEDLVPLPKLQRVRRQFIQLNRMHAGVGRSRIRELFVEYVNDNI